MFPQEKEQSRPPRGETIDMSMVSLPLGPLFSEAMDYVGVFLTLSHQAAAAKR